MDNPFHLPDEVNSLERALRELAPAPARLDIARTMYRAGQAAAQAHRSGARSWQIATGVLSVVTLTLGALLAMPSQPQIVYVPRDSDSVATPSTPQMAVNSVAPRAGQTAVDSHSARPVRTLAMQPWLSSLSRQRSIDVTLDELLSRSPTTGATGGMAHRPALASRDWPQLLDDL
jgi:hypothetical protein